MVEWIRYRQNSVGDRSCAKKSTLDMTMNSGLNTNVHLVAESRACVSGGITRFMELPNAKPPAIHREPLEFTYERGRFSATFINGRLVWNGGKLDDSVRGQRLAFDR